MEKEASINEVGSSWLLRAILAVIAILCAAIIVAVGGKGSSQSFPGRARYIAVFILRSLGRPFTQTTENVSRARHILKDIYHYVDLIYKAVYEDNPQRRSSDGQ